MKSISKVPLSYESPDLCYQMWWELNLIVISLHSGFIKQ